MARHHCQFALRGDLKQPAQGSPCTFRQKAIQHFTTPNSTQNCNENMSVQTLVTLLKKFTPNAKYCLSTWISCWISNGPCFNNSSRCFQNQMGPLKSQALQNCNTFPLTPLTHCKKLWLERVCFKDVASEKSSPAIQGWTLKKNNFALEKFDTGPSTWIFSPSKKIQRSNLFVACFSFTPAC